MRQTGRGWVDRGGEPFDEPFDVAIDEVVISMCWARAGRVNLFDNDLVFVQDLAIGAMPPTGRDSCGWRRFLAGGYVGRVVAGFAADGALIRSLRCAATCSAGRRSCRRLAYRTGPSDG